MKHFLIIFTLLFLFFNVSKADDSKIHPDLKAKMIQTSPMEKIPVYIVFNSHLNLRDFDDISYDTPKQERRRIVMSGFKTSLISLKEKLEHILKANKVRLTDMK